MAHYRLKCVEGDCLLPYDDIIHCSKHPSSLLKTEYSEKRVEKAEAQGIWKYRDFLPCKNILETDSGPVTFLAKEYGSSLGLDYLWVTFSGYWPEKGAKTLSCSFKEYQAIVTCQYIYEKGGKVLVVPSAGNTARAFAHQIRFYPDMQLILMVPEKNISRLWLPQPPTENINLISVRGDFYDTISLADHLCRVEGFTSEGGAWNVARRDGVSSIILDAALTIGRIPDHYFQAIGSGICAISTWEASLRLIQDGRFGKRLPILNLAQNLPFTPICMAWKAGRRRIEPDHDMPDAARAIKSMYADVLSNRNPPYSLTGGVYDALCATGGRCYEVSRKEAVTESRAFRSLEGIDLDPAAAVAAGAVRQAVEKGLIKRDDIISLNISGGGMERLFKDQNTYSVPVQFTVSDKTDLVV